MRNIALLFTTSLFLTATGVFAQDRSGYERDFAPISESLRDWDPVRGAWLSEAIPAVVNQEPIPVRTFPENITPIEMLALVPEDTRSQIATTAESNQNQSSNSVFWSGVHNMVRNVSCSPRKGRSYGDPHLVSFDGERFSFQTVGEFVLAKNDNGRMEVQTRQKPVGDDFSLNTAVAMNVNGDRVCLYAEDIPDNFQGIPLRVNGQPVEVTGGHYFLPNGGVVHRTGNNYIIDWPTGESVNARSGRTGGLSFYNVAVHIRGCSDNYSGVLGNADGIGRNDFDGTAWRTPTTIFAGNNNGNWERERSAFVTRNFAEQHRLTQANSLFDYAIGQSTFTFTDRSYPRVIRTVNDLDPRQRQRAERMCSDAGVPRADMNGCIFDNAYMNIPPVVEPPIREPIDPETVTPVRNPVTNTNPEPPVQNPIRSASGGDTRTPVTTSGDTRSTSPVKTETDMREDTRDENSTITLPRGSGEETTPTRSPSTETPTRSKPRFTLPTRSTPTRTKSTPSVPSRSTTPTRTTPSRSTPVGGRRGG
jgi:hypothetical protein